MARVDFPTIVIGAGAAGLVVAIGLAKAGRKVLLIEKGNYGGDCTNFGCIPSKTLIHWAKRLHTARSFSPHLAVDTSEALRRTKRVVKHFLDHEDPKTLETLGVSTITGEARFLDAQTVEVNGKRLRASNFVICTGSSAAIAPIEGLEKVPYRTNESIFELEKIPRRLGVLGGGAIGCELSQAFGRLGAEVSIFEALPSLMGRVEPEAASVIQSCLEQEGVRVLTGSSVTQLRPDGSSIIVSTKDQEITVDELLVSVGRKPNIQGLGLDAAGVDYDSSGIKTDAYGRSNQKHIWAVGDCSGGALFTHIAEAQARAVLTSLLLPFFFKKKLPTAPLAHVTFTDPELACIGLTEEQATARYGKSKLAIYTLPMESVDRAQCSGRTEGFVKVVTKKWSSKILGACIVAPHAGEMLMEIATAIHAGLPLRKLASMIHPYPVYSQAIRKAADQWLSQTIVPLFIRGKKS